MLVTCRSADDVAEVRTSGLIATLPRSGSWLLSEALQLTGLVGQPAEYFRPDFLSQFSRSRAYVATISSEVRSTYPATIVDTSIVTAVSIRASSCDCRASSRKTQSRKTVCPSR